MGSHEMRKREGEREREREKERERERERLHDLSDKRVCLDR